MIMMFAQAQPGFSDTVITWGVILGLSIIASNIITTAVLLVNRKQRREINWAFEPANKSEFDLHKSECRLGQEKLRQELKEDRQRNEIHASERSKTLFAEMKENRVTLENKIDDSHTRLEKRINRLSVGVAQLCMRGGINMPGEDVEI